MLELARRTASIRTETPQKWLRAYHYEHDDLTVYMFFNSSMTSEIHTKVTFYGTMPEVKYDILMQKSEKMIMIQYKNKSNKRVKVGGEE